MMISPEKYYDLNIKNKNKKELEKEIRSLKREIKQLVNIIANKDDMEILVLTPKYEMQLSFNEEVLRMAEAELKEITKK